MRPENKRMQEFLKQHGIEATPKYISKGSLKHTWRLWNKDIYWTEDIQEKLNSLGFKDFDGQPLRKYSGNGGGFSVFIRGHYELLTKEATT